MSAGFSFAGRVTRYARRKLKKFIPRTRQHATQLNDNVPAWPILDTPPRRNLTVAFIADEFTYYCLSPEFNTIRITPNNWREVLENTPVDMLFVETAWKANERSWSVQIVGDKAPSRALIDCVQWCRDNAIPTVIWTKEDPVHYEDCIDTVRLFDYVFTTDSDSIPRYHHDLGHERVWTMSFAAQPLIHNPMRSPTEKIGEGREGVCFAGMYFRDKYPQRREQMDMLLPAAALAAQKTRTRFDIFARNHTIRQAYEFPEELQSHIRGELDYPSMLTAYRSYNAMLNVSSVTTSPSMSPRRVFELAACATPIVTTHTPALDTIFDDTKLFYVNNHDEAYNTLRALQNNPHWADTYAYRAWHTVMTAHTYEHRINNVLTHIGLHDHVTTPPLVSTITMAKRPNNIHHLLDTLAAQQHVNLQIVIGTHGFNATTEMKKYAQDHKLNVVWTPIDTTTSLGEGLNILISKTDGDIIAKIDDDDWYASHYLFDAVSTLSFTTADLVGKQSYYMYLENENMTVLRFPGHEYRQTNFISGATFVGTRTLFTTIPFPNKTHGEDTTLLRQATQENATIISNGRLGFVKGACLE